MRTRLTAAFAAVVGVVLAVTGVLLYGLFARDLDAATDRVLADRGRDLSRLAGEGESARAAVAESGERLVQLYRADGRLVAASRRLRSRPLLSPREVGRARATPIKLTRSEVPGTGDGARLRAFALPRGARAQVAVIGEATDRREHELRRLALLLAIALPGALALASYTGYRVAGAALRPVERMRARAAEITDSDLSERLPRPRTGDEIDRLGTTFNALLDRLAGALERERRVVSDASHELRTPLAVLQTELEVALRADPDPARLRAALTAALGDARRLSRLADDLLVLARADQGQLPLRLEPLDVQDLLEHAAARHRETTSQASRSLEVAIDIPGGAVVLADRDRTEQALDNLIVNTLRYGAGAIELRAQPGPDGLVELSVRDNGPGYPAAYLSNAFERFSQADGSHGGQGSGLGLAIVAAIARAHGGSASAANHRHGGAITTLALPAA